MWDAYRHGRNNGALEEENTAHHGPQSSLVCSCCYSGSDTAVRILFNELICAAYRSDIDTLLQVLQSETQI